MLLERQLPGYGFMRNLILIIAVLVLVGCPKPRPFETGEVVNPPHGCVEGRIKDVDC